jgi:septal ring factor EnvC (AmiA/AmiB activator)
MFRTTALATAVLLAATAAMAQDVPGIENCSVEKAIDRRTGCMQSNINYLHQQLTKTTAESRQRLDAANREIAALKESVAKLQAGIDELQAAAKKAAEPKPK